MKIFLASDHAGFELKEKIETFLKGRGYDVEDMGPNQFDPNDDYPTFIHPAAVKVAETPGSLGIIFGGSGQAEAMVANKVKGVRCGLFYSPVAPYEAADVTGRKSDNPFEMVRLTREHNDANVLSIGARFVPLEKAEKAVELFVTAPFSNEERHLRRLAEIEELEKDS